MKAKYNSDEGYGSHWPTLERAVQLTHGPVLECGMGLWSTRRLHDLCVPAKRLLVSLDASDDVRQDFADLKCEHHRIVPIRPWPRPEEQDWCRFDYHSQPWSVALVDQEADARLISIAALWFEPVDFIVVHDVDCPTYQFKPLLGAFRFQWTAHVPMPETCVVSNRRPWPG